MDRVKLQLSNKKGRLGQLSNAYFFHLLSPEPSLNGIFFSFIPTEKNLLVQENNRHLQKQRTMLNYLGSQSDWLN